MASKSEPAARIRQTVITEFEVTGLFQYRGPLRVSESISGEYGQRVSAVWVPCANNYRFSEFNKNDWGALFEASTGARTFTANTPDLITKNALDISKIIAFSDEIYVKIQMSGARSLGLDALGGSGDLYESLSSLRGDKKSEYLKTIHAISILSETSATLAIHNSPPQWESISSALGKCSFIGISSFLGYQSLDPSPLLIFFVPLGVIILGASSGIAEGLQLDLRERIHKAISTEQKSEIDQ